jgi:hypothetical protein
MLLEAGHHSGNTGFLESGLFLPRCMTLHLQSTVLNVRPQSYNTFMIFILKCSDRSANIIDDGNYSNFFRNIKMY